MSSKVWCPGALLFRYSKWWYKMKMPKSPKHHQVVIVAQDCQSMLAFWPLLSLKAEKQQLAESFESNDDAIRSYINTCMQHFEIKIVNQNRNSVGSNNVRSSMFEAQCSKPKIGCLSSITNIWTLSSLLDVGKNDVRVSSMSNLVNLVKALLGSKFDVQSLKAKNRVFEIDHQKMNTLEFVGCSKKWCSSQFNE